MYGYLIAPASSTRNFLKLGMSVAGAVIYSVPPFKHLPVAPNNVTALKNFMFYGAAIDAEASCHVLEGLGQSWNVVSSMKMTLSPSCSYSVCSLRAKAMRSVCKRDS